MSPVCIDADADLERDTVVVEAAMSARDRLRSIRARDDARHLGRARDRHAGECTRRRKQA
jgi:hypothetical protein